MTRHPFISAVSALIYISAVVSVLQFGSALFGEEDSMIIPVAMLSLFVLSAAIMGYLFCLEPIKQYLDGERESAVRLFLSTVGYFALLTVILFIVAYLIA